MIGPFVDDTDGATSETGLTIANTDIRLSKNGGNMAAKNSGGGTHDENGYYQITLDATDTDTVGRLQISIKVTGALAVWKEAQVLEEDIYDALFGASAAGFDSNARVAVGDMASGVIDSDSIAASALDGKGDWALASVLGAVADAAAAGDPTATDTAVAYLKQIVNVLVGSDGVGTFPAEAAPANAVSFAEVLRAIHADVTGLNGAAMRGTDGANTTTPPTAAAIADQVWDEATADHTSAGTYGKAVGDGVTAWVTATGFSTHDAAAVADAVWDEAQADHTSAGSFGLIASEIATLQTSVDDVPTVAEFNARTLAAADYFDPAEDTVSNVTSVVTTTNLTNLPSIPTNWLTASGIEASALDGKGDWNVGKTGYSLVATGADLVLCDGRTLPNTLEIIAAAVAGRISGAGTGTETFLGMDEATTRVVVTVDGSGNRTDIVYS